MYAPLFFFLISLNNTPTYDMGRCFLRKIQEKIDYHDNPSNELLRGIKLTNYLEMYGKIIWFFLNNFQRKLWKSYCRYKLKV